MTQFKIVGGQKLKGTINIAGAKNSALKILPAAILANSPSTIRNVPDITDIHRMIDILKSIGVQIEFENGIVAINPKTLNSYQPDKKLIKRLRGSIVLMGPLLARFGKAVFSQPGGCLIGARAIDDHLDVMAQLGIKVKIKGAEFHLRGKAKANTIVLNKMSVTATENAIMASVFSKGTTVIKVAAAEPEIIDLANYLNQMGAKISGAGTHEIKVEGVRSLSGTDYKVMPDRIEAGTYLIAAIATNSEVEIGPLRTDHINIVLKKLLSVGAKFQIIKRDGEEFIRTKRRGELSSLGIDTRTYPGFPTDLQSPYAVLMTLAKGTCQIFETLFEGRFLYLDELKFMGANVEVLSPHIIKVAGPCSLKGRKISGHDIRGCAALVIAALISKGETMIDDVEFIDRGYEKMDAKLRRAGALIERIE